MSFQGFLFGVHCIGPKTLCVTSWILQTAKIKSITESFWVKGIFEIDSYHFRSSQPLVSLKIKTVASLLRGTWAIIPINYLKKTWPIHRFLRPFLWRFLLPRRHLLLSKTCRSSRLQMFFKIGVLKNFAIFTGKHLCWSLFLIKWQAFRCFPENIGKFLRAAFFIEHLRRLLLQMFCFTLYFQKDVAKYTVAIHCIIVSLWNLKSLSFAFNRCTTRCHSLLLFANLCLSLSFVDTRCHSFYYSLSLVVIRCTTRCHSLYHSPVFL